MLIQRLSRRVRLGRVVFCTESFPSRNYRRRSRAITKKQRKNRDRHIGLELLESPKSQALRDSISNRSR